MDFNSESNERYRKSVLTTVDDIGEMITGGVEESLSLGWPVYQSGTAIEPHETWHAIKRRGLYRVEGSVIFTASESGLVAVRIVLDGKELPASRVPLRVQAGQTVAITPCVPAFDRSMSAALTPKLELTISGVPGIITRTMLSTTKLA